MATIRKNTKKAKELFNKNLKCTVYSLDNNFIGNTVSKEWAMKKLYEFSRAKLYEGEEGYCIQVHDNLWIDLEVI